MNLLATLIALSTALPSGMPSHKAPKPRTVSPTWTMVLAKSAPRATYSLRRIPTGPLTLEKRPLLTHRDVRAYHWKTHTLVLTAAAKKRLQKRWLSLLGRTFVVTVNGKRLYAGLVFSSFYSSTRKVPVAIPTSQGLRIERAYPTARYAAGPDPRPQAAVKKVFAHLRRLR